MNRSASITRQDGTVVAAKRIVSDDTTEYVLFQNQDEGAHAQPAAAHTQPEEAEEGGGLRVQGARCRGGPGGGGMAYDYRGGFGYERLGPSGSSVIGHTISMRRAPARSRHPP